VAAPASVRVRSTARQAGSPKSRFGVASAEEGSGVRTASGRRGERGVEGTAMAAAAVRDGEISVGRGGTRGIWTSGGVAGVGEVEGLTGGSFGWVPLHSE
jgi:hypothetical protein